MDNTNLSVFDQCFELGQNYAKKTGLLLNNLKFGLYHILDNIEKDTEQLKLKRDSKVKETNDSIDKLKIELESISKKTKEIDNNINNLDCENNKLISEIQGKRISCNRDIQDKERRIATNKNKLKQGNLSRQRSNFEYNFIKIVFWFSSLSLVTIYWFFWYNGLFSSGLNEIISEKGIYSAIIDPQFIFSAFQNGNYLGLLVSIFLTTFPLGLSYLFHSNLKEKELKSIFITIGSLLLALILDLILAYRIIEHVFSFKRFLGEAADESFSIKYCFTEVAFYLIFFISFFAYIIWGFFFMKLKFLKQPNEQIENIINALEEDKNKLLKELDDCDFKLKNQESDYIRAKEAIENQKAKEQERLIKIELDLEISKKILDDIDLKPITSEFDLKRRANSFYAGYMKIYRDKSNKDKSDDEIDNEIKKQESVIDDFIEEVKKSGKFFIV